MSHDLSELIEDLSDRDLDRLQERLDIRAEERRHEEEAYIHRMAEEATARKHCQNCKRYISCRERKKSKCDSCGYRQEWFR